MHSKFRPRLFNSNALFIFQIIHPICSRQLIFYCSNLWCIIDAALKCNFDRTVSDPAYERVLTEAVTGKERRKEQRLAINWKSQLIFVAFSLIFSLGLVASFLDISCGRSRATTTTTTTKTATITTTTKTNIFISLRIFSSSDRSNPL